jgi:glycosyltransferase involved in cell wall biosynthesis
VFDSTSPIDPHLEAPFNRAIRILVNNRTPGLAGARNAGVLAASGDLVAFCDDDDEWLPEKLRLQIDLLKAKSGVAATCGIRVKYAGRTVERLSKQQEITLGDLLRRRHMEVHSSTILINRSLLLDEVGLVDESTQGYVEDYDLLLRITRVARLVAVKKPLVLVYWHAASYFDSRWATVIDDLSYLIAKHPELRTDRKGMARIYGQLAFAHAALGHKREALKFVANCFALNRLESRGYLSLLVGAGIIPSSTLVQFAHSIGRGI